MRHLPPMNAIRCCQCNRKLAQGRYMALAIKCPRCKRPRNYRHRHFEHR